MVVRKGSPDEVALEAGKDASLIVTDRGYMRPQKRWREKVAREAGCLVTQVESDVVVPVELASGQAGARGADAQAEDPGVPRRLPGRAHTDEGREAVARTCRPKAWTSRDIEKVLDGMDLDRSVGA